MACEGCKQQIREDDGTKDKAQGIANQSKEWVGIYKEEGRTQYCIGAECNGKPVERWVTPEKDVQ